MIILAIETSCDDTCVAILEIKNLPRIEPKVLVRGQKSPHQSKLGAGQAKIKSFEILSNIVSSQVKLHAKYGGVWPYLAKREHQKNLPVVFKKTLKGAKISVKEIDFIAVTVGPGLEPCLWVGVNFAKDLAEKMKAPIVPVNHIEAHILENTINNQQSTINNFPAICLVVSGGHTQLILMTNIGKYKILGETRDDAAGECFDKAARILGLGYPGGPAIAAEAVKYRNIEISKYQVRLPRPMIYQKNYDFSFSGLKTAVLYDFKNRSPEIRKSKNYIREMAKEIQQAVIDVLIQKTLKAAKEYKAKSIILGGGVTSNEELRKQFQLTISNQQLAINFLVPPKIYCTDNAAMVAVAGYFHYLEGEKSDLEKIKANANLRLE